ncbi:MAG: hypothetical protein ACOC3V_02740 [bacterium]
MKNKVYIETNSGEFEIYFLDYPKWKMFPYELKCDKVKKMWQEWWKNNGGIPSQE